MRPFKKLSTGVIAFTAALSLATAALAANISGAGATFPFPIYAKWAGAYKGVSGNSLNYQSIGSGGGIKQIESKTVTFGASDMPLTTQELNRYGLLQFPTVIGGVVPVVNIRGVAPGALVLDGPILASIFLGKISKWNDPAIKKLNASLNLPDQVITTVHRSDGSGTTFIFTNYLSKVSKEWETKVGRGTSVNWPVGLGGKGNEGVSGQVQQTPNSIGYVELIYAVQNKMKTGKVKNLAGAWVQASLGGVTAAAASSKEMPEDFRVSITNAPGKDAYPISSFTWLLIPEKISDPTKKKAIKDFLAWMLADGQTMTSALAYAPLPKAVVAKELKAIAKIQ